MVLSKFANKSFFTRLLSGIVLVALMLATIIPGETFFCGKSFDFSSRRI